MGLNAVFHRILRKREEQERKALEQALVDGVDYLRDKPIPLMLDLVSPLRPDGKRTPSGFRKPIPVEYRPETAAQNKGERVRSPFDHRNSLEQLVRRTERKS